MVIIGLVPGSLSLSAHVLFSYNSLHCSHTHGGDGGDVVEGPSQMFSLHG